MRSQNDFLDSSHAFVVVAHADPTMFRRLTQRLLEIGPVFAHVDATTNNLGWVVDNPDVVFLDNRVSVYWGHWSMVEATVRLIERALMSSEISRITLLSGTHYLLWSPSEIAVRAASTGDVIAARQAPNMPDGSRPEIDYRRRFVATKSPTSVLQKLANAFVNRVVYVGRPLEWRTLVGPEGMRAGSQWWSLTRDTAEFLVKQIRADGALVRYFKKVNCPDEKVFATLFAELDPSPNESGTTFVKWAGRANPEGIALRDLEAARADKKYWFARKFSSLNDAELLEWLDEVTHQ